MSDQNDRPGVPPIRMKLSTAARRLDMSKRKFRQLAVEQGEFTILPPPDERGPSITLFVPTVEVDVYALRGLAGLREFRAQQAGQVKPRRKAARA